MACSTFETKVYYILKHSRKKKKKVNNKEQEDAIAERVKAAVVAIILKKINVNMEDQDKVGIVDTIAEEVKKSAMEDVLCILDDSTVEDFSSSDFYARTAIIEKKLKPFLVEQLDELDAHLEMQDETGTIIHVNPEERIFVMDMEGASDEVDVIAEELFAKVKWFLVDFVRDELIVARIDEVTEEVKKFVVELFLSKLGVNVEEQDKAAIVDVFADKVKEFFFRFRDNLKQKLAITEERLKPFLVEELNKLDVNLEVHSEDGTMDAIVEEVEKFILLELKTSEVGTVDDIAEAVKKFLVSTLDWFGDVRFPEDGIEFDLELQHDENLDCPCFRSYLSVTSKHGNVMHGGIEIYAKESADVEDIFQVLLQMEIASFRLQAVHETYLAAVEDFLSNNPFLRRLSVGDHYLKKDQDLVRNVIKSSKSLSTLLLEHSAGGEDEAAKKLDQSLREYLRHIHESDSLKTLDLSQVTILTPVAIEGLVEGIAKSSKIKTLDMSTGNDYRGEPIADISDLAEVLKNNNETIEEWNIGGRIMEGAAESILQCAKLLEGSNSLKKLDLRAPSGLNECWIDPDTWISFGKALSQNRTLQYLDISDHLLSKESWKAFGEGLKANTSLLTLKASKPFYHKEKDTDIILPVFEALRENQTLESLELSKFDLSDSFASLKVLESSLIENKSLKSLELSGSGMTDDGIAILSRSLPKMKGMEKLNLSRHSCTSKGAQAFAEGMKNNYNIVSVDFGGHYLGGYMCGYVPPAGANGFEKEYHEIEYYARMNRKGRRCMATPAVHPSLWAFILEKALKKEKPLGCFMWEDVRNKDWFAGDHDTSIDAVFYLLRDVLKFLPVYTQEENNMQPFGEEA